MNEKTTLEIIAPTVEEAIAQGLAQLGLTADAVSVEVLDSGNKGLFGLGRPQVRVRLTVHPVSPQKRSHQRLSRPKRNRNAPRRMPSLLPLSHPRRESTPNPSLSMIRC